MSNIIQKLQERKKKKTLFTLPKDEKKSVVSRDITYFEKNEQSVKNYLEELKLPQVIIDEINFSIFSEESIDSYSVCEVKNVNKSYDLTFSTDDPRMGTIENNKLCSTCGKINEECSGHIGRIKLPVTIIHPFYRTYAIQALQCICFNCGKLLVTEKKIHSERWNILQGAKRLSKIYEYCKTNGVRCQDPRCGPKPIFTSASFENTERRVTYKIKKGKIEEENYFSVETIKPKLEAISKRDAALLGFLNSHPGNFIISSIPVIPLSARPYIVRDGEKKEDYLTSTYCDILNKKIESVQEFDRDNKETLYSEIIFLFGNLVKTNFVKSEGEDSRLPNKDVCKSITDRIIGKKGIMRNHILGKRVDYSGRTPIGPNRNLEFNHIAIPLLMKQVTVPEKATVYNIDVLNSLARKGEISYICPSRGNLSGRMLAFNINKHKISIGDKVGRFTQEGDIILFNRQPTLQRQSFIGQKVTFQDKASIGLHLSSTPGLNADFDGDEGNVHFLQTIDSKVEASIIMISSNVIISYKDSTPMSVLVYNSLAGGYMLTRSETLLTNEEFFMGIESLKNISSDYISDNLETLFDRAKIQKDSPVIPGRILASVLFPPDFWYKGGKSPVYISNGIILRGTINKSNIGSAPQSIIQSFVKWYGGKTTSDFISACNFLFNWYITLGGLTVGIKDCLPDGIESFKNFRDSEAEKLDKAFYNLGEELVDNLKKEQIISQKTNLIKESKASIDKKLDEIMGDDNNLKIMKESGSKGKKEGMMNVVGYCGQIQIENTIPVKKITNKKRWLSNFSIYDRSIYSTGYSNRSYLEGMEPESFFASAQAGRLSVIDRTLSTARTGYLQRRLVKSQEDLIMGYDGAVYSQSGSIIQFSYGVGFGVDKMVTDTSDKGVKFYSFINIGELEGRINTIDGVANLTTREGIISIFGDILQEEYEFSLDMEKEDFDDDDDDIEDITVEEDFDDDDNDIEDDDDDIDE